MRWAFSGVNLRYGQYCLTLNGDGDRRRQPRLTIGSPKFAEALFALGRPAALLVAVGPLHALVALLRLDRQRCDRPRLKPADADRLVGLLAIPVGAGVEPRQCGVDLRDQLAPAVAGAELDRPFGFE